MMLQMMAVHGFLSMVNHNHFVIYLSISPRGSQSADWHQLPESQSEELTISVIEIKSTTSTYRAQGMTISAWIGQQVR
jgi:hypothetical protein